MKNFIIVVIATLFFSGVAVGQQESPPTNPAPPGGQQSQPRTLNKPVVCASIDEVLKEIQKYKEQPSIILKTIEKTTIMLFFNLETHTWTVIEIAPGGKVACLLGNGSDESSYKFNKKYLQNLFGLMVSF